MSGFSWAEEPIIVKHYQKQARYEFGLKVLDLALSKLGQDYQINGPDFPEINEGRGELLVIEGKLDLQFMSATLHREAKMIPIRIPIYQGLLGLRLLLVKPELHAFIQEIEDVEGLRKFVGGHGTHWGDLPVYEANGLQVVTSTQYENLFKMLKHGRFDYFHRGVNEIWAELARYPNDFVIADNIMLYYPQPVYFFVSKHRPELARKLERGMKMALSDGSYKALFQSYYEETLQRANLTSRRLILLNNPGASPDVPRVRLEWWLPPDKMPR
jgi:ABC-type amino acid transport substrate-binding protein